MQLFYSTKVLSDLIILDKAETNHCINVLRNNIGDTINIVDGKGALYNCKIIKLERQECYATILNKNNNFNNNHYKVHIAISCLKNHARMEWFVEKAVEIGVDKISFLNCKRTLRNKVKIERLNKIAIVAMKQTLKTKLPIIDGVLDIYDFISKIDDNNRFICHLEDELNNSIFNYKNKFTKNKSSCILIGPEGDFTKNEISLAENIGFISITLGTNRLRSETAGVVACHLLNIINNYR